MKFDNIELKNFRQYGGSQRAKFSTDPTKNITVFNGNNGAGKTSLFVAINWCLYGEGTAENIGELINKEAVKQSPIGKDILAYVKLSIRHNGERFIASRELVGTKLKDGSVETRSKSSFTLMKIRADGQAVDVKNPIGTINTILPSNVRTFFLFDGEKIDEFAKPDSADEVRYAIYNVLKLEVLERSQKHLSDVAVGYRKELKQSSSGELRELIEKEESSREQKDKAVAKQQELERERDSAKRKIADIDKRLREWEGARNLQQQRDQTQKDLEEGESDLRNLIKEIRDLVISSHSLLAHEALKKARSILDKKRERGEIPSGIRQQFIQDLLEQGECICGRPIKENDPAHKHLMNLLARSVPGSLEDKVLNNNMSLNVLTLQNKKSPQQLDAAMKRKSRLTESINDLQSRLDDITRQLKGSPQEEISGLEKQRHNFDSDIERYHIEIGKCKATIESQEAEIAKLTKQIEEAKKRKSKDDLLMKKVSLAQKSADAIEKIYQTFAEEMRQSIETKTKQIFKKLVWKGSHFQDIKLGADYKLDVIDRYGSFARPELSAGERQILSLSFITAMVQVSEEEVPIVMDTPFGRLSSEHRASITENLPNLAPQLILFVTDEELHDQARKNLKKSIGEEYHLQFNIKTSCTSIEEVGS